MPSVTSVSSTLGPITSDLPACSKVRECSRRALAICSPDRSRAARNRRLVDAVPELERDRFSISRRTSPYTWRPSPGRSGSRTASAASGNVGADVGGHDHDCVRQIRAAAAPSLNQPSSNACRNRFKQQWVPFSISSSSTTEHGLSCSRLVSIPPRAADDAARHADQLVHRHRAVLVFGHVDAIIFFSSPNRIRPPPCRARSCRRRRAQEQQHAVGPVEPALSGPLSSTSAAPAPGPPAPADDAPAETLLEILEALADVAEHHVERDPRRSDTTCTTSLAVTSQRRSISARTAAVSSQPIALSGRCRCRS